MPTEEQKLREQLSRYDALPQKLKPKEENAGSIWDPRPPDDCTPELRYQPKHESGPEFKIGDRDARYGKRQAIPPFCYPNPGSLTTPELENAELQAFVVWERGASYLESCIRHTLSRIEGKEVDQALFAERWSYLLGLWGSRGMIPPTDEQMQAWARELRVKWDQDAIKRGGRN